MLWVSGVQMVGGWGRKAEEEEDLFKERERVARTHELAPPRNHARYQISAIGVHILC